MPTSYFFRVFPHHKLNETETSLPANIHLKQENSSLQPTDSLLALPISSENFAKVTIGVKRSAKLLPYHNFLGLNIDTAFSLSGIFNTLELQQRDSKDNTTEQQAKGRKG